MEIALLNQRANEQIITGSYEHIKDIEKFIEEQLDRNMTEEQRRDVLFSLLFFDPLSVKLFYMIGSSFRRSGLEGEALGFFRVAWTLVINFRH